MASESMEEFVRVPLCVVYLSEEQFDSFLSRYPGINYTHTCPALGGAVIQLS